MPQLDLRSALDETAGRVPLSEADGVVERAADTVERAGRLDIGARVDQRVEGFHVVAAGRPVQGRLIVHAVVARVDIGAGVDEHRDGLPDAREVPGPIGRDVEQRQRVPRGADDPG